MKCGGSKEDISSCKQAASCGNHHLWVGVRNCCGFGNVLEETQSKAAKEHDSGGP